METENSFVKRLIQNYEQDIMGNRYSFELSDGMILKFEIKPENVPHLLGVRKLHLRQANCKSSLEIYDMLKSGVIKQCHFEQHKEEYKKLMNFNRLVTLLHCGDAVKIVKRRGQLNSSYLLYIDHQPAEIMHLGIAKNDAGLWYPESLFVIQKRHVTAYIEGQLSVEIISVTVENEISKSVYYI